MPQQRQGNQQNFEVLVDGNVVGQCKPGFEYYPNEYRSYATSAFNVAGGSHTIQFLGLDSAGGDNTAFIDAVTILSPSSPIVADSGFETPSVGSGGLYDFQYNPGAPPGPFRGTLESAGMTAGLPKAIPTRPKANRWAFCNLPIPPSARRFRLPPAALT